MNYVPSENILKLMVLTDKICVEEDDDYKEIVIHLKNIIESGKLEIQKSRTVKNKIKCYETMCVTITNVLSNIKII